MVITTKNFGDLEIDEERIIEFEEGMPGFNNEKHFVLLQKEEAIFCWLQSTNSEGIAFPLLDTFSVLPEYNPIVNDEELESIGGFDLENMLIYNVAVIPENIEETRVNLKAPIIINTLLRKGKQVVANNEEYGLRHYILQDLKKKATESAGEE